MIPILFDAGVREYNNNGIGALVDVGYCTVTEERNGAFELELQYPVNGLHYKELTVGRQILAKPNETKQPQAFRIYQISKPMNSVVTVYAEHISYDLSGIVVMPFSANSVISALQGIKNNSTVGNPFEFWTDKTTVANMSQDIPMSARAYLGGVQGSILDVYTGEYEFDNYTVKLYQNRGQDNGVVIAYAKNLTGVTCEEHGDGIVTGVLGYWKYQSEEEEENEEEIVVYGNLIMVEENNLPYSRNIAVDFSEDFENQPTMEQLDQKSRAYLASVKNQPYYSVSVEFVNLGDTEEYAQYKGLERVELCDIVTVKHPVYGISVMAKVIKTVFDAVNEKYESIEIGEASSNIANTIAAQEKEISQKTSYSDLKKAVINATNAITGNKGGYVVLDPPTNPQRLLIMDRPSKEEAVNVWQWNLNGLGFSSNGIDGDYATAITHDGQIVADFITTGTLSANLIKAGVLQDKSGNSFFSLDTGNIQAGGGVYSTNIDYGRLTQSNTDAGGLIGGFSPVYFTETTDVYQGIYYNGNNSNSLGVGIYRNKDDASEVIAEFTLDEQYCVRTNNGLKDIPWSVWHRRPITSNGTTTSVDMAIGISKTSGGTPCIALNQGESSTDDCTTRLEIFKTNGNAYTSLRGCHKGNRSPELELGENLTWKAPVVIGGDGTWYTGKIASIFGDVYIDGDISASTVTNRSDRTIKTEIEKTKTENALEVINGLKIYDYKLQSSGESVKMGLMADEAPEQILGKDGKSINLYSYCGLIAKSVQELSKIVDEMRKNDG